MIHPNSEPQIDLDGLLDEIQNGLKQSAIGSDSGGLTPREIDDYFKRVVPDYERTLVFASIAGVPFQEQLRRRDAWRRARVGLEGHNDRHGSRLDQKMPESR